jgi:alpha-galactosidase
MRYPLTPIWIVCLVSFCTAVSAGDGRQGPAGQPNGLALTPPMGWNSWNKFGCNIDAALIRRMADAMVSSGMKDAGYQYVIIDDCWHGERDAHGDIQPDAKRFPDGVMHLADYVHSRGLRLGIYSDAGVKTCAGRPGSRGYEYQDAKQYAAWGVDYLKYDWCNTGTENAQAAYLTMSDALRASGRAIVFSMCEWGSNQPWLWARNTGNSWRTTADIYDAWEGKKDYSIGVMNILDANAELYPFAGPGHWNDPDMLEVGNGGMSDTEYRAHFSLWAMLAAPLIAGNDLSDMSAATRAILLNKEIIAIDQDALGIQAHRAAKIGDAEVWVRPVRGGGRAVALLNRGTAPIPIAVTWQQLDYPDQLHARLRDVWTAEDLGTAKARYSTLVPAHSVVVLKVQP